MYVTIWLSGMVVFIMNTGSDISCHNISNTIKQDIQTSYDTIENFGEINGTIYRISDWEVSCESSPKSIGSIK